MPLRDNVYIRKSHVSGNGLYASRNFIKGQTVFIMRGKMKFIKCETREDAMSEPNTIGIKKNWWLKPPEPYVYINHSCEPNVGIIGTVTFKALRKIHKDEELFFDYSICEEGDWEMKCKCGSVNCRKIIGSVKTLPRKTFKKYLPFIPRYFQLVYQRQYKLV